MAQFEPTSRAERERAFVHAYERLVRAGAAYDRGHRSEAPNIAKEVFNFVYDHGGTTSVLTQLGLRGALAFVSTVEKPPPDKVPLGAVLVSPDLRLVDDYYWPDAMDLLPRLGEGAPTVLLPVEGWLAETVLAWHGRGTITRMELLKFTRDTAGGGHVAAKHHRNPSNDKLLEMLRGAWLFLQQRMPDGTARGPEPEVIAWATVRQIGWEVEETLRRGCLDLVVRADLNPAPGPRMVPMPPFS
jgi:hypothetical protein